jgi:PAS domain S-box-containing protein
MSIPEPDSHSASGILAGLRRRAEDVDVAKVHLPLELVKEVTPEDAQLLFHELRVHQVELELQNEELRRVQLELETAHERYFDLYDMAPVGYCTVDDKGLIREANLTAASLLGVSRASLVKRQILRFMPRDQQLVYQQTCQRLHISGKTQTSELQLQKDNGGLIWVTLTVNAGKSPKGATTLRVMLQDITVRMQLDQQLQEKNGALVIANQVADSANRAKSDFLTGMSHELRSPLNAILGFAQLLNAGSPTLTPVQKSSTDQILSGGWHLLALVNEILDLSGIEAGQMPLVMAPEPLDEVLKECIAMIEQLAANTGIQINFHSIDVPCVVQAERRRLKQVMINLLTNAIKYNRKEGSVSVTWTLLPKRRVRVSVHDTGMGLSADQLSQLFQPFNRLGQEVSALEGTGIGLVVSKRLVELMGGSMGVRSTVGAGSVFWFELALAAQTP